MLEPGRVASHRHADLLLSQRLFEPARILLSRHKSHHLPGGGTLQSDHRELPTGQRIQ